MGKTLNFRRATLWWQLLYPFARISYNAVVAIVSYTHSPFHLPSSQGLVFPSKAADLATPASFSMGKERGLCMNPWCMARPHDCSSFKDSNWNSADNGDAVLVFLVKIYSAARDRK